MDGSHGECLCSLPLTEAGRGSISTPGGYWTGGVDPRAKKDKNLQKFGKMLKDSP